MRNIWIALTIFIVACTGFKPEDSSKSYSAKVDDPEKLLSLATQTLKQKQPEKAISNYISPVVNDCDSKINVPGIKIYCARSSTETLYYLGLSAVENKNAEVLNSTCSNAYYLLGYANLELGLAKKAKENILSALQLSPMNSEYLSELGYIYQIQKDWINSLITFEQAEESAEAFSPEQVKNIELARALRGSGYALIEMGKLDEAEEKYKQCLLIDNQDKKALHELQYIKKLRLKSQ